MRGKKTAKSDEMHTVTLVMRVVEDAIVFASIMQDDYRALGKAGRLEQIFCWDLDIPGRRGFGAIHREDAGPLMLSLHEFMKSDEFMKSEAAEGETNLPEERERSATKGVTH